ncbi:hypothetical protein Pmani_036281 [Petrolisthes manimaculis]|uniref:Uncharacterized protein n=1 Tax=Petrolisthes manimaculis TaxID=1843537 RepID=A0AAE1TPJ7_9EUCA|nr:hypothetical protein Pmani_036281 [Petrolisthes manimaculis]
MSGSGSPFEPHQHRYVKHEKVQTRKLSDSTVEDGESTVERKKYKLKGKSKKDDGMDTSSECSYSGMKLRGSQSSLCIPEVIVSSEPDRSVREEEGFVQTKVIKRNLPKTSDKNIFKRLSSSKESLHDDGSGHSVTQHTLSVSSNEDPGFFSSLHRLVRKTTSGSSNEDQPSLKQRLAKRLSSVSSSDDREITDANLEKAYSTSSLSGKRKKTPPKRPPPPRLVFDKFNTYGQYINADSQSVPETPPPKPPRLFQMLSGNKKSLEVESLLEAHNYRRYSLVDSDLDMIRSFQHRRDHVELSNQESITDNEADVMYTYTKFPLGDTTDDDESPIDYPLSPEPDDSYSLGAVNISGALQLSLGRCGFPPSPPSVTPPPPPPPDTPPPPLPSGHGSEDEDGETLKDDDNNKEGLGLSTPPEVPVSLRLKTPVSEEDNLESVHSCWSFGTEEDIQRENESEEGKELQRLCTRKPEKYKEELNKTAKNIVTRTKVMTSGHYKPGSVGMEKKISSPDSVNSQGKKTSVKLSTTHIPKQDAISIRNSSPEDNIHESPDDNYKKLPRTTKQVSKIVTKTSKTSSGHKVSPVPTARHKWSSIEFKGIEDETVTPEDKASTRVTKHKLEIRKVTPGNTRGTPLDEKTVNALLMKKVNSEDSSTSSSPVPLPTPRTSKDQMKPLPAPRQTKTSVTPPSRPSSAMSSTSERPLLNMFFEKLLQTHAACDLDRLSSSVDLVSQERSIVPRISRHLSRSESHLLQDGHDDEDKFSKYQNASVDDVRNWKLKSCLDSSTFSDPPSLCESYKSESHVVPQRALFSPTGSRGWVSENEVSRTTANGSSHHHMAQSTLAHPHPRPRTRPTFTRTNAVSYSSDEDVQDGECRYGGTRGTNIVVAEGATTASGPYSVWVRRASDSLLAKPKKELHHQEQHLNRHNTIGQLTEAGYSGDTEDEEIPSVQNR